MKSQQRHQVSVCAYGPRAKAARERSGEKDFLDPKVMQHAAHCEIADKPEMLKLAVTVKKESTYDFAHCGVCSRNWYAWDRPPVEAAQR